MQQLTLNKKVSTVIIKLPIIATQSDVTEALSFNTNSIFGIRLNDLNDDLRKRYKTHYSPTVYG